MSQRDEMMRECGVALLMETLGEQQPVIYKRPNGESFEWIVIVDSQRGTDGYDVSTGDAVKAVRRRITGPRDTFAANGVTTIQRNAKVVLAGEEWATELPECHFGNSLVRIGLIRRFSSRHEELESHGVV
jgi:hypothetical protein